MLFNQKTIHVAVGLALGAAVLLSGCKEQTVIGQANAAEGMQRPPSEVVVVTTKAQDVRIETMLTGRTTAYNVAEVRPQVQGILQKRLFTEGQEVKAGDLLYQIDDSLYEASLKSAQATLAQARATLVQATADAKRSRELLKTNAVSKQSDDAAQATLKSAQAAVRAGEAAVRTAEINLGYTKVRSPIDGRVSRSEFTEGALLSAYQTSPLTTVRQLDPIYVDVTQTAEELLRMQREIASGSLKTDDSGAAEVSITFADGTAYPLTGKLTFTDAQVEEDTGMVKLRAVFPNPDRQLLPGLYVRAKLSEGVRQGGIVVHMQSVMRDLRGDPYVYVVTPDNKVEQRAITVGQTMGSNWLVTSGLKEGERVMYEGFQRTAPGATVNAKELDPKSVPEGKPLF
ncbi:efflux RND transporter periplasmic adaptor subunit [Sutterella sp.]|uniref:efflux RND transporter periplasmic adaptor subunit n=1 Tax=Sutterella sp. TaxID=1981025 RepID=UPI0026E0ABAD|nr:efflux RND transporter periplasmic adaptor subunit [Sutterella sp.]MDO5530465.1 efflux RND transporter periplasmic adaptor subunit [Sutterella sp.]